MRELLKHLKAGYLLTAILYLLLGILLIIWPDITGAVVSYTLGGILLLHGILSIVNYFVQDDFSGFFRHDLIFGILAVLLGLFVLVRPSLIIGLLPVVLAIIMIVDSAVNIQSSIELKRTGCRNWWLTLVLSLLTIALCLLLLINPFSAGVALILFVGVCLAVNGLSDLITYFIVSYRIRKAKKELEGI